MHVVSAAVDNITGSAYHFFLLRGSPCQIPEPIKRNFGENLFFLFFLSTYNDREMQLNLDARKPLLSILLTLFYTGEGGCDKSF